MNERDLLRLADLNLFTFYKEYARWIPNTEINETSDRIYINSGSTFPGCNFALNVSEETVETPADFIAAARAYFSGKKKGFLLILRSHCDQPIIQYCMDHKYFIIADEVGMVLDAKAKGAEVPGGADLHWVDGQAELLSYGEVVSEAFMDLDFPGEVSKPFFTDARRVLNPFSVMAVVYYQGQPASAAMAILSHGIAGVYWVGTRKNARGNGLAKYCVQEVSNAAFDMGARKVVLQASKFGAPVYPRIGYREFTRYPNFFCLTK